MLGVEPGEKRKRRHCELGQSLACAATEMRVQCRPSRVTVGQGGAEDAVQGKHGDGGMTWAGAELRRRCRPSLVAQAKHGDSG